MGAYIKSRKIKHTHAWGKRMKHCIMLERLYIVRSQSCLNWFIGGVYGYRLALIKIFVKFQSKNKMHIEILKYKKR